MVNLEHKLTTDDLIIEYMTARIKLGYEPGFNTSEFVTFLYEASNHFDIEDINFNNDELFDDFFKRKVSYIEPHITREEGDIILPTNRFGTCDLASISTRLLPRKQREAIREVIKNWLATEPKRSIDMDREVKSYDVDFGQRAAACLVNSIWDNYVGQRVDANEWPKQCTSIYKFMLKTDLASVIKVPSIKDDLFDFYSEVSKRIAAMPKTQGDNLLLSNKSGCFLPVSNFKLATEGYEKLLSYCGDTKFEISWLSGRYYTTSVVKRKYSYDEDYDYERKGYGLGNDEVKMLVKALNHHQSNS